MLKIMGKNIFIFASCNSASGRPWHLGVVHVVLTILLTVQMSYCSQRQFLIYLTPVKTQLLEDKLT